MRTKSVPSKKEQKESDRSVQNQGDGDRRGKQRRRAKKKDSGRPMELWEIQQTLGRGEFVEVGHDHLVI